MARKKKIENFFKGLITKLEAKSIPRGASSDSLNWLTDGDKIELRRGMYLLGSDVGAGRVTGLHRTKKANGTEILYKTWGKKLEYLDTVTEDWIEIGTDQLGTSADGEQVAFSDYVTSAGNQMWFSSPNSSLYKVMTANPTSLTDMYASATNFKGLISIILNRMFLWNTASDKAGVYGSYIDVLNSTAVSDESIGTGDAIVKTFTGTLAFKAGGAKRTCFAIVANDEDSVETFSDDYSGILTGSLGGTGTINYTTGAISVTFVTAPGVGKDIRATYSWEDSTNNGIADFTKSATRLAGQGFLFRQDVGGDIKNVMTYNDIQYCLHQEKTWRLNIGVDDTEATNRIYRENAGIPNWRAAISTGEGIYFVDDSDVSNPQFRVLTLDAGSSETVPVTKSYSLDLSGYLFDRAVAIEFQDYVLFACRTSASDFNNKVFLFNKIYQTWDILDYYVSSFAIYNGALVAGDEITGNVYELFSGLDDDDSVVLNNWAGKDDDLDIDRLKKTKRLVVQGLISKDQSFNVYLNLDNSGYVLSDTIRGDGTYVDSGSAITVGSYTIGKKPVGGGNVSITAFNYKKEIKIKIDKFEKIKIRFVALGIGYLSVSMYDFKDIRIKSQRIPKKYR